MTRSILAFGITLFISAISISALGQWVSKASAKKKRSEVNSIVYNGKLYAFLGFKDSALSVEPSAEVYDPVLNTWTLLSSMPSNKAITHQGVALIDNNIWNIGGRVGRLPAPLTSEIWIYNITNNTWSAGPQLKDPATGNPLLWGAGGAILLGRTLHIFGGFIINACNNDQSTYHLTLNVDEWLANQSQPAPWKNELAPLPLKRNHFGTVALGGKIYVIGGQYGHDCDGGLDKQYSHVYDPVTNTWTQLPMLPWPRSHTEGSTFAIDGKIYLVAGQGSNSVSTNKVIIFDPAANNGAGSWTVDNTLTLPKSYEGLSSKVINNTFIISHGGEGGSQGTRNTTYSRTLSRNPVYKFGFSSGCANFAMSSESSSKVQTLLFTIDGSKDYTISSSANWLTVSKNATGTANANGVDVELTANTTGLATGNYSTTITATGIEGGTVYTAASYCINLTVNGDSFSPSGTLEAENALLYRAIVASNAPGFTGTGFADYVNNTGDFVEWTVNTANAGSVSLDFRYANGSSANRPLKLEVNGVVVAASLAFPPSGGWANNWSIVNSTVSLNSGANKIKLTAIGSSGPNIDNLSWQQGPSNLKASQKNNLVASAQLSPFITSASPEDFKVSVAPNPVSASARLKLKTSSDIGAAVTVLDAAGKIYKHMFFKNGKADHLNFSVEELPSGTYILLVKQGNKKATTRFIVDKN